MFRPRALTKVLANLALVCAAAFSQTSASGVDAGVSQVPATAPPRADFVRQAIRDERDIFSAPFHVKPRDVRWIAPLAGAIALLVATDARNMQERIHTSGVADRSLKVSDAGSAALGAIPVYLWWRGWHEGDDYSRDTGILGIRAAVDSLVAAESLRLITERARPTLTGGSGGFFHGGATSSSFPSLHAAGAWAAAEVVAERYPGWLSKTAAYGLATAVSFTRVTGREHYPSDVAVGAALGFLVGRYVAHTGHGTRDWTAPEKRTAPSGSSYVPMDSWIYPALDRLAAFGMIPSQTSGLRPWTRAECRRQLSEADGRSRGETPEAVRLIAALHRELDRAESEGSAVTVDSLYLRSGVIAGPVLNDSFHFGQTWTDDSGRPFGRGWNSDAGFTAHAELGPFFASMRGEYQNAPGTPAQSLTVRQTISYLDTNPLMPATAQASTSRFRAVEASAGVRVGDFAVSVGKQELWWGPTQDAPFSFSTNAEPTKNLKISTIHPIRLPGLLNHLGDIRGEFILGKLGGQQYTWRPWFNAQKVSFKLTENLELGFTRWAIFWGEGHPITAGSFIRDFTTTYSPVATAGYGSAADPGDRKGGFDFRYRIPGLRNWLTLYSDTYSDDDPSPLAAPRRAAINPGLYLTRVPGISRLDVRVEAPSTTPMDEGWDRGGQYIYYNSQYHSGNTNYGYLLGNGVGRDGRALEGWVSYHLTARDKIEFGYRQFKGSVNFLPGGETQSDATLKASFPLGSGWFASSQFQYERFWAPLLGGPHRNLSGWMQLTWEPKWRVLL
ncbi:MAG TPA: capsule assembly Wzi family protein [Bryobacteraceae bacterium]|jgi:membrane-associated phospholipid phosphatase|nr:capsule assembly Wzi family protein [Bryobacteraceae bacterium]